MSMRSLLPGRHLISTRPVTLAVTADVHPSRFPRPSTLLFPDEYLGSGQSSSPRLLGHGTIDSAS
jgi:hypothetical protein